MLDLSPHLPYISPSPLHLPTSPPHLPASPRQARVVCASCAAGRHWRDRRGGAASCDMAPSEWRQLCTEVRDHTCRLDLARISARSPLDLAYIS